MEIWAIALAACVVSAAAVSGRGLSWLRFLLVMAAVFIAYVGGMKMSDSQWGRAIAPKLEQRHMGQVASTLTPGSVMKYLDIAFDPCAVLDWRERLRRLAPECQNK